MQRRACTKIIKGILLKCVTVVTKRKRKGVDANFTVLSDFLDTRHAIV